MRNAEPTYSVQMARPFLRVLARYPCFPRELLQGSASAAENVRLPVAASQQFLQRMTDLVGEPNLGLLAARETPPGTFEVLEFVVFSAPTWGAAIEAAFRYIHLMNEAADFRIEIAGSKAQLVLASKVPLTRAGIDFQSAMLHLAAARWFRRQPSELEVWFTYPEPEDISEHRAIFGDARLRFAAPWNGFVHDAAMLDRPVPGADPRVHALLRHHAERLLAELSPGDDLIRNVRAQLLDSLKDGPLTASTIAARMGVARRTLTRRLAEHGTSFSELLDGVRRQTATHYVVTSDHNLVDIAFLVGFSESSTFVRAFKRWHGVAPMAYRRAQQRSAP